MKIKTVPAIVVLASIIFGGEAYASSDVNSFPQTTITTPINLNTADVNQIEGKVKGIGQKRAEAIVAYRTEHGAFKSFGDLAHVKGIGDAFVKSHLDALNKAFTLS
jgi:competence protein ComEA